MRTTVRRKRQKRNPAAATGGLEDNAFYLFSRITGWRTKALTELLRPLDVTVPEWRVLIVLEAHDGCTIGELSDMTAVDRTTLTRTINQMEQARFVVRRPDNHDRRRIKLRLADPKGRDLLAKTRIKVAEHDLVALAGLSPEQIRTMRIALHRILQNSITAYFAGEALRRSAKRSKSGSDRS